MHKQLKIGIDIDGVLRDMFGSYLRVIKKNYPDYLKSDICYSYDFSNIDLPYKKKLDILFNEFPKEIFLDSKPISGAIENYEILKNWAEENEHQLVCATSQEERLIHFTYSWLGKYNLNFKELYITNEKEKLPLDYLIDDSPENYKKWIKYGNAEEKFIIVDATYNQDIKATNRIFRLSEAIDILKNKDGNK